MMLLVYMGWRKKWWNSFSQSPLFHFDNDAHPDGEEIEVLPEDLESDKEDEEAEPIAAADGDAGGDGPELIVAKKNHTKTQPASYSGRCAKIAPTPCSS